MSKKKLAGIIVGCIIVVIVVIVITHLPWKYTLTTNTIPSGAGSVSPSGGKYGRGVQVTLTASPASGYRFVNWTGDAGTIGNVDTTSTNITMNGDYSITANFVAVYALNISIIGDGSITTPGEGTSTYDEGTVVNLVASPASGYLFLFWFGDVGTIDNVRAPTTTITMNGDYSITANFAARCSSCGG